MTMPQPGILAPVPSHARYLEFGVVPDGDVVAVLRDLASRAAPETAFIGFGPGLVRGLGNSIAGLRPFPAMRGPHCQAPSTQADLWCSVRGDDRGRITHEARAITRMLKPAFRCDRIVDGCLATITRILPIIYEFSEIRRKCDRVEQLVWMRMGELCDTAVDLFDSIGDG